MKKLLNSIAIVLIISGFSINMTATEGTGASTTKGEYQKIGAQGAQFLKIGAGARGAAIGAYTSITNDLTSITWNPAGVADVKSFSLHNSYAGWLANYTHDFFAVSVPLGDFTLAASVISFSTGEAEWTTVEKPGDNNIHYKISDICVGATIAGYLTDQFSFGITAKYVTNSLKELSSTGIAFDVGTNYDLGFQGLKIGFSIMNLGTPMQYDGSDLNSSKEWKEELNSMPLDVQFLTSSFNMPLIFRAGLSSMVYEQEDHQLLAAGDFYTYSDVPEEFALGLEYKWKKIISLRAGYLFGHDQFGLSFGAGIDYNFGGLGGVFDYCAQPTADFGLVHRISLNVGFE